MSTREHLVTALRGGTPDVTPLTVYDYFVDDMTSDKWRRLFERGLCLTQHVSVVKHVEHGVTDSYEEKREGTDVYAISRKETPIGTLERITRNGWHHKDWIVEPGDYRIRRWIVENTELVPVYEAFEEQEARLGEHGIPLVMGSRTPAMSINVDWAGTERFCTDVAMEVPELFDLYEAQKKQFMAETRLIAAGPGEFVKWLENMTISMLGPGRYAELLMSVYEEACPILQAAGKRVMVHYDGELAIISDQIAKAPFDMIESLTEPPEGNLMYDECRRLWPDLVFWANVNVALYYGPAEALRDAVLAKRERAGRRALAFEVSEDLPGNWETSIPVVLDALAG